LKRQTIPLNFRIFRKNVSVLMCTLACSL